MNVKSLKSKAAVLVACAVVSGGLAGDVLAQGQPGGQGGRREQQPQRQGGGPGGWGGGRMGGMMEGFMGPAVTGRQIESYGKILNLTADQKATLKMLHEGYTEQARETGDAARTEMEKLREEMRESEDREGLMAKMQTSMRKTRDARKKQDESFASDVKAILTPEQMQKWPTVERMQRREASTRRGFMSGQRVDLVAMVNENKVSADSQKAVAPILEQYEVELDRELVRRNDWQETQFEKMGDLRAEGDFEGIQKLIEEGRGLEVKVRDVHRKYAKQIEGALAESERAEFQQAFKAASFPEVYRPTTASQALTAASNLKDLTPEQQEKLSAMRSSYDKSLGTVNDKLAKAIEEGEMTFSIANFGRGRGGDEESPAQVLRREKRDLNRTTTDAIKKLLTPEQIEKLPKPEEEERGDRGGGGGQRRGRMEEN